MNNTSELYGYLSLAFRIAIQTTHNLTRLPPYWLWYKHVDRKILFKECLRSHSPWMALAMVGYALPDPAHDWPYIWDISMGRPAAHPPRCYHRHTLSPVACVQVFCPACAKKSPQIMDASIDSLQRAADDFLCPHCNTPCWPWRSTSVVSFPDSAFYAAEGGDRIDNLVPFIPNPRRV